MNLKPDGIYAMYLRKSRADIEAEKRERHETLSKHQHILNELAARYGIKVAKVFREIVSGDTIEARPEMKILLSEVRSGVYDGVLVTEISRLARGNTIDQGTVSEAFRLSNTKIITPSKVYDPSDEADETYFDFELFMARQEYRYIKKRMQKGRQISRQNGNWVYGHVPTGYRKEGLRLVPDENAPIMKAALLSLANGERTQTETILFLRQVLPIRKWSGGSVCETLANPIYAGYIKTKPIYPVAYDPESYIKANCEPIISLQDHANIVNRMIARSKTKNGYHLRNAFAGLIRCAKCGRALVYNYDHGYPALQHQHGVSVPKCQCFPVSYQKAFDELTKAILDEIPSMSYIQSLTDYSSTIAELEKKLRHTKKIKQDLFEKFENGLYTASEFKERKTIRDNEITALERQINTFKDKERRTAPISVSTAELKEAILHDSPEQVNELLKLLIDHIDYEKPSKAEDPCFSLFFK